MEYKIDLGVWKSVFAVPSVIVDKHIKLAGATQLEVILWLLRYADREPSTLDISEALSMHEADVRDCLQYWVETGVIAVNGNVISPASPLEEKADELNTETDAMSDLRTDSSVPETAKPVPVQEKAKEMSVSKKRALSRPEKPDIKYLSQRMNDDPSIAFLMQSADEIFGRMTNNNDKATLLLIHEYDGLPVEVIIMLMQYAFGIGKGNMRYIEKTAINWSDEEITSLEAAEKKIRQLTSGRDAAKRVQRIIGADEHSPTEKESEFADLWLNKWCFDPEMIRAAYEVCVDAKGKYIPKYTSSILESWHNSGFTTVEQTKRRKNDKYTNKKSTRLKGYEPTYDISEYESTSVLDDDDWK